MYCKYCGKLISGDSDVYCDHCGREVTPDTPQEDIKQQKNKAKIIITITSIAVLLAITAGIWFFTSEKGNISDSQEPVDTANQETVSLEIHQIDSSMFPEISIYFSILDSQGVPVSGLTADMFEIFEQNSQIKTFEFEPSIKRMPISISLIMDNSGSMTGNPLAQAKVSARQFLDYVNISGGDKVEVMEFNSEVYVRLPFSSSGDLLSAAIETMGPEGQTALYDALYIGLVRAYEQTGPKCILAFTDGEENASKHSLQEVIDLSKAAAIPVFIIGVGDAVNESALRDIALCTGGKYYYAPTALDLEEIYKSVYNEQKDQYSLKYKSLESPDKSEWHNIKLSCSNKIYQGNTEKEYVPDMNYNLPIEFLYSSITASSVLTPQKDPNTQAKIEYIPYHAIDGKNETAWVEGVPGDGAGEWIRIDFVRPVELSGAYIKNGYFKSEKRLLQNHRVKRVRVEFSDGSREEFDLSDPVWLNFNVLMQGEGEKIDFSIPHTTSYVKFTILETYSGTVGEDTCISEIKLF